ncbi:MAG: smalltalk protein [Bacteroidales bacterium]|nr:smalltalk protein [Bacteroidales bacterium]MBR4338904.1 smalltalk protein [Bacteroidaceae bacterium]
MKTISWKRIIEILIAILTAIAGTLSVQSCM